MSEMRSVGVIFHLDNGSTVNIVMPMVNARIAMSEWREGRLSPFHGNKDDQCPWMIKSDMIQAIQVVELNQLQPGAVSKDTIPSKPVPGSSGMKNG